MALLTAGYWPATYNPSNYWVADYWPEYRVSTVTPVIGGGITYRYSDKKQREKREENEILMFIKEFLRTQERG